MAKLKIYGGPRSRARRCFWLATELGLDFEQVNVDISKGEQKSPEFLKLNPNGHVPVMDDDGFLLFESLAINLYLAKKHGVPLAPQNPKDEALTTQWSFWAVNEIEPHLIIVLLHRMALPEEKRVAATGDEAEEKLAGPLRVLDAALSERDYLLGNAFTVADLNVAAVLSLALRVSVDLSKFPNARAWLDSCLGRPAAKAFA